uniref:THAP-type domain-containing protein n=1 Tax=Amphimedon queenslandica TaxID=400682 RepID=A0A1X7UV67_AMPQE
MAIKAAAKFYRFPTEPDLKAKWIAAIKREKWEPTGCSRICSDHFITGNILGMRSKSPNHLDYVPSVFVYSKSCTENGLQRFHRSVARSTKCRSKFQSNLALVAVDDDPGEYDMEDSEVEESDDDPDGHDMEDSEAEESEDEAEDDIDGVGSTDKGIADGVEEDTFNDDIDDNSECDNDDNEGNDNFEDRYEEDAAESTDYCEDYDDKVNGTNSSYMYNRISDIDLEDKEIEIGELQLEIEKLNDVIEKYEQENQLLREDNCLLKQENSCIKAILAQLQIANCSNVHAIISLKRNVEVMQSKLEKNNFGANFITDNDRKTSFYTELVSFQMFLTLFNLLKPLFTTKISTRPLINEFFTLFKLRLDVPYQDIAYRAGLSSDEVGKIF